MTILVTGSAGFVGSAVVRALLRRGEQVRAMVRPGRGARVEALRASGELPGVEIVEADLLDEATLARAVEGCRVVFHVAADYRLWVPDGRAMFATNVGGSVALARAAAAAGVERVVYTSSVAAIKPPEPGASPSDEDTPTREEDLVGIYKRSKYLAEREIFKAARALGLALVAVNPSAPVGPGDARPTPTGRMILMAARGRIPAFVETGLNVVHVDDVAEGHILACERGNPNERYILGGEDMPLSEILATIAEIAGRPAPRIRLSHRVVWPVAVLEETWARITGREPMATRDALAMSRKWMYYSSQRAREKLGYKTRPVRQAFEDALAYWRARGEL